MMEKGGKALKKLEDMSLVDRVAAVAADVDSKRDEFRSIDAHELASLLGINDAEQPATPDWSLSYIIPRSPIEDILAYAEEEESDKELLQSFLAPERYKELLSKIDLQEEGKTNYAKVSEFLTDEERWKIEEYDAERRYESEGADGCHCYAYNSIKAPNGKNPLKRLTAKNSGVCRRRWHLHRIENAI